MAKRRGNDRDRQHPQRRPAPRRERSAPDAGPEQLALFQALREALRSDEPLDLLSLVSALLEMTEPRPADPLGLDEGRPQADRVDLVDSLAETSYAETTAALSVMRVLAGDEGTREAAGRALEGRRQPMPDWLDRLDQARVEADTWFLTHVLGDGDDHLIGVRLASGEGLSALVYVDHDLGTVVKDAFVVPRELEDLALTVGQAASEPGQSLTRMEPALARATVEAAIAEGARTYPPLTTDSWPACRPLVEWMLRMLPAGGSAPQRREWSQEEQLEVVEGFFASAFGSPLDGVEERSLAHDLVRFGTGYASGDPYRWSAVTVEMLLADWAPRTLVADVPHLMRLPDVLHAFVRYAHDEVGIADHLTEETLAAVDAWEGEYLRLVMSDAVSARRPLPEELLLAGDADGPVLPAGLDEGQVAEMVLTSLARAVGGRRQLADLGTDPLPDEPFAWDDVAEDVHDAVRETLALCDACADELLDVEHRTAMRRFLARAAVGDPALFRRKASRARGAAAVAWVVCLANDSVQRYAPGGGVQDLLAWFGVSGSVSQRAQPMLRANGVRSSGGPGSMDLGTPDLLVSARRQDLVRLREWWAGE